MAKFVPSGSTVLSIGGWEEQRKAADRPFPGLPVREKQRCDRCVHKGKEKA